MGQTTVTEQKSELSLSPSEEFVRRATRFLREVSGWCQDHGLTVENRVVSLKEEQIAEYDAPSLHISKDGVLLAKLLPVGSKIIGANGRVDVVGRLTRHALLLFLDKERAFSASTIPEARTRTFSSTSMRSRVGGDGWYWIEARIRRPKRVDESLFLDLLTDVSDYEF